MRAPERAVGLAAWLLRDAAREKTHRKEALDELKAELANTKATLASALEDKAKLQARMESSNAALITMTRAYGASEKERQALMWALENAHAASKEGTKCG